MATTHPRIGFIGVGVIGHGIENLVTKGFPLTVRAHRNRVPVEDLIAKGAKEATSNAELARDADIVFLCVTGASQVEEAVFGADGLAKAARKGLTIIDTSTSEPATTTKMREALAPLGVRFIDAPLARTPVEAEQGRLNIMVGADDATFAELKPVFAAFCENIVHAGPAGHGIRRVPLIPVCSRCSSARCSKAATYRDLNSRCRMPQRIFAITRTSPNR